MIGVFSVTFEHFAAKLLSAELPLRRRSTMSRRPYLDNKRAFICMGRLLASLPVDDFPPTLTLFLNMFSVLIIVWLYDCSLRKISKVFVIDELRCCSLCCGEGAATKLAWLLHWSGTGSRSFRQPATADRSWSTGGAKVSIVSTRTNQLSHVTTD
jgi:hypothetical protein